LEVALSEREDQLTTLRQRIERITDQRDAYASELEQVSQERDKLKEENDVLNKKLEEILAPKPALPLSKTDIYIVQEGDTLESIAAKEDIYGDRSRWKGIFEENKDVIGSAPDNLVPGTKLIIPRP
jgi:nucleoid-associated protein YgaU